jgi:MOSC domain-containing protein YiiM
MTHEASISSIWIATTAGAELQSLSRAKVAQARGIVGDRYHTGDGSFSRWPGAGRAITFIAHESIVAVREEHGIDIDGGRSRRNVITEGIDLEELIGRQFRIGTATFKGSRSCQPCRYLERFLEPGAFQAMKSHGGIRAEVEKSGSINVGDTIHPFGTRTHLP